MEVTIYVTYSGKRITMFKDFTSSDNKTKVKPWLFYVLASNGTDSRDHNQITVSRDSRDDREDSGSEDDSKGTIRVGRDYQVITPSWVPPERKKLVLTNRIHFHDCTKIIFVDTLRKVYYLYYLYF